MGWWIFGKKDDHEEFRSDIKHAFSSVKKDISNAAEWIKHLHTRDKHHENRVDNIDERLSNIENELENIKNFMTFFSSRMNRGFSKQLFKQEQTAVYKQTAVEGVQTGVQTPVQTAFLGNLSVMERAIVWVLLNTDMKLSCEDIAAILNKEQATIRGQLNSIKQKSENLIAEMIEKNGKKRYYVDEKLKEMILSDMSQTKIKVRKKKQLEVER